MLNGLCTQELPGKLSYLNDVTKYQPECYVSSENESRLWGGVTLEGITAKGESVELNCRIGMKTLELNFRSGI